MIGFIDTFLNNLSYSKSITIAHNKSLPKNHSIFVTRGIQYCHVFRAPWLTITGSGSDHCIYWHLLVHLSYSQWIIAAHNKWLPKTRSILVLSLYFYNHSFGTWLSCYDFARTTLKIRPYCWQSLLLRRCLTIDVLLFCAFASARKCLANCCL
jgi:hypothetical protein